MLVGVGVGGDTGLLGGGVVGGGGLQFQIHSSARIHVQIYLNKKIIQSWKRLASDFGE